MESGYVSQRQSRSLLGAMEGPMYTGKYSSRFILALVASGQIPMSQNYLCFTQLCFGEFNLRQGKTVCKCRWAKITRGENNLVYSINQIK